MKVLMFSTSMIDVSVELANEMSKEIEVVLVLPKEGLELYLGKNFRDFSSKSVKLIAYNSYRYRSFKNIKFMYNLYRLIDKWKPDIIHVQGGGHPWLSLISPILKKSTVVNTVHDPHPHTGDKMAKGRLLEIFFINYLTDFFLVHGEKLKTDLIKLHSLKNNRVGIVPLGGFKISPKHKLVRKSQKNVLFFGRIWDYKGLDDLIKSEPKISSKIKDYTITIAGVGDDFSKYSKLIINSDKFIIINRHIEYDELYSLFNAASIIVCPYKDATQSSLPPLAFQFGKPVIVTNVGSLAETVDHGIDGFVIEPNNTDSLSSHIIEILENDKLRKRMGQKALEKSRTKLSYKHIAKKTIENYVEARYLWNK